MRVWMGIVCVTMMLTGSASAQDAGASTPRAFVGALGGVTFGEATAPMAAGQLGVRLAGDFHVIGEFGHMHNVITSDLQSQFEIVEALLALTSGEEAVVDGRVSALYGFGGLRWASGMGRVSPFAEAGIGAARLSLNADATLGGRDVSDEVEAEFRDEDSKVTKPLFVAAAGLTWSPRPSLHLDAGYRYARIFTDAPELNVHSLFAALKFGF